MRNNEKCPAVAGWASDGDKTRGASMSIHIIVHPEDLVKLRQEDYAAFWQARRRYLLAQAEAYAERYEAERAEGSDET